MSFNPNYGKQAQEVYSVENYIKYQILSCFFNNADISQTNS